MSHSSYFLDQRNQLQHETMCQLDLIGKEIDAGRLSLEEGSRMADALAKKSQADCDLLTQSHLDFVKRTKTRRLALLVAATLIVACVAYWLTTGSAP